MKSLFLLAIVAGSTLRPVSCQETNVVSSQLLEATPRRLSKKGKKNKGGKDDFDICYEEDDEIGFGSTVIVDFIGMPPVSDEEMDILAAEFIRTYNYLAASQCGYGARGILDAEYDPDIHSGLRPVVGRRELQGKNYGKKGGKGGGKKGGDDGPTVEFPMVLRAAAVVCADCGDDPTLFTPSSRRGRYRDLLGVVGGSNRHTSRRVQSGKKSGKKGSGGRPDGDACSCPPPTEEEFAQVYNAKVMELGLGTVVDTVIKVAELVEIPCGPEGDYEYLVDVECELGDDVEKITAHEVALLEQSYEASYNEVNALNPDLCDTEFHVVTGVDIISDLERRRRARKLQRRTGTFRALISGRNRGPRRSSGFNDAFRRHLKESTPVEHEPFFLRALQPTDTCLCPRDAEFREPTTTEFVDVYDNNVRYLAAQCKLHVCVGIVGIEVFPVESPDSPDVSQESEDDPPSPMSPVSKSP